MMKKFLVIALMACMLLMAGCAKETQEAPELLTPVGATMDGIPAVIGNMESINVYSAAVAPAYTAMHFTEDTRIGSISYPLGSKVKAGDVILSMDVADIQGKIGALDAEAGQIAAQAEMDKQLYDIDMELYTLYMEKAATEAERYDIETEMLLYQLEYENTAATREERLAAIADEKAVLEPQLEGRSIVAPTDGTVTYVGCSVGQTIGAYDIVCVVTDDTVPMIQSDFVSAGEIADAVEIYALVNGNRYQLTAQSVDENDYAVAMLRGSKYLSMFTPDSADDLVIGDSAVVCVVNMYMENVLKVPINSVFEEDDQYYVYILEGESRVRRDVSIGAMSAGEVEIVSGLEEGEVVYVGD